MSTNAKSTKRSKNSAKAGRLDPRRPFDPAVVKNAEEIASRYTVLVSPEPDVGYLGRILEMPYVMADGKNRAACIEQTLEAAAAVVATMIERGEAPPSPASDEKRSEQLNIRLSVMEKLQLESAAEQKGYRSVSDY